MTEPLSPYHRRLMVFLSVATFFEGYDLLALTQLLPNLRGHFGLSPTEGGDMVAFINVGTVLAYLLVRLADRIGRKPVLTITIVGYTLASLASGLSVGPWMFATFQLLARVFLLSEWAVAQVIAAEELPAARRGALLGVIQGASTLGGIVCAGVIPLLLRTPLGWRSVYLAGSVPLVIAMFARRGLRETERFARGDVKLDRPFTAIVHSAHRNRMLHLAAIWFVTYLCTQNVLTFWKEFAVAERHFTDAQVGGCVTVGAVASVPLVFLAGPMLDRLGRRAGAAVIFVTMSVGAWVAYHGETRAVLTAGLVLSMFGLSAVLTVLNAYTTELFPTTLRADAFAWSNNLLGRVGYVLSPLALGPLAERYGWGRTIGSTAVFPLVALGLILALLPETRGRELEDTARIVT